MFGIHTHKERLGFCLKVMPSLVRDSVHLMNASKAGCLRAEKRSLAWRPALWQLSVWALQSCGPGSDFSVWMWCLETLQHDAT